MKRTTILFISALFLLSVPAYPMSQPAIYGFEQNTGNWKTKKGSVSVSAEYYKEGKQSLKWEAPADAILSVDVGEFTASDKNAASFYIYCPEITSDTLYVTFYNDAKPVRTAGILLNFKGWRAFCRAYQDYADNDDGKINKVGFVRKSAGKKTLALYLDDVRFDRETDKNFIAGYHMLPDMEYIRNGTEVLELYTKNTDIPLNCPAADAKEALALLRSKNNLPYKKASGKQVERAREFVASLDLRENKDGEIIGKPVNTMERIKPEELFAHANTLSFLASSESDRELCVKYIDYLLGQGIAEGLNYNNRYSDYEFVRTVPLAFFAALQVADEKQKPELLKLIKWVIHYGKLYYHPDEYPTRLDADILTNYLQYYYAYAAEQPDESLQAREFKAFSRFLERNTEYTRGARGILRPDGTGFHHQSHYNNYMYAFRQWINFAHKLKGTPFRIDGQSYERMSKAVVSMYIMAGRDKDVNHITANSLSGRNTYHKGGSRIAVYKAEFRQLIEVGGDIKGEPVDKELAGAYNYFFMTDEYDVPQVSYNGFYQFNFSPIGVYRSNDWVVTMRSPTTRFWGTEIYNKTNRLGRYQSNGTLEVVYNGGLANSGLPTNQDSGGWDWNVIPGTTTVHYTSWVDMMPLGNTSQRFDQYALTKSFSGALAWGDTGMFAADFDQNDTWSRRAYEATNLTYKKSVFAFDGMLLSLGSGIGASGDYGDDMITATNLFQEIKTGRNGNMVVDGMEITEIPYTETLAQDKAHWILTPVSTGYIIPAGNDPLIVKCGPQVTPKQTGEDAEDPKTKQNAAKAYIDHGVKTAGRKYSFIVIPKADKDKLSMTLDNINSLFRVNYHEPSLHAVTHLPSQVDAYAFFEPVDGVEGVVAASGTELLLMTKEEAGVRSFAVCNPNMKPAPDERYVWIERDTEACVMLRGKWEKAGDGTGAVKVGYEGENTKLYFTLSKGMPVYFSLKKL